MLPHLEDAQHRCTQCRELRRFELLHYLCARGHGTSRTRALDRDRSRRIRQDESPPQIAIDNETRREGSDETISRAGAVDRWYMVPGDFDHAIGAKGDEP